MPEDPAFRMTLTERHTGERRIFARDEGLSAVRTGNWKSQLDRNQRGELMRLQAWSFEAEHFPNLQWTLLTAPKDTFFVTSDRPVVWFIPDVGGADSPAALKHPDVELTVPLSSRYAFLATKNRPPAGTVIRPSDVNKRTFLLSEKFVGSARAEDINETVS